MSVSPQARIRPPSGSPSHSSDLWGLREACDRSTAARFQICSPRADVGGAQHAPFVLAQEEVADHGERLVLRVAAGQDLAGVEAAEPGSACPPAGCARSRHSPATASGPRRGSARSAASPARGRNRPARARRTEPSAIRPGFRHAACFPLAAARGDEIRARDRRDQRVTLVARGRRGPALLAGLEVEPAKPPSAIDQREQRAADPADEQAGSECSFPGRSCATVARTVAGPAPSDVLPWEEEVMAKPASASALLGGRAPGGDPLVVAAAGG